jgi:hypothetical protein
MNKSAFELLISTGVIDRVVLGIRWDGQIVVFAYGDDYVGENQIQAQRGGSRGFRSFDASIRFIRSCGWKGQIVVDSVRV